MLLSVGFCSVMVILLNIFPEVFFNLFGKDDAFVSAGTPVARVVSIGMLFMSVANIWLNGVTGTGKTRVNLMIEIVAITMYLAYTFIWNLHF